MHIYFSIVDILFSVDSPKGLLMTQFHQEHQQVFGQQQNAGNDITNSNQSLTFGAVQGPADLPALLVHLQSAVALATTDGTLPEETGIDANAALEKAVLQTKKPTPDKKSILDYLTTAKSLIEILLPLVP
jgi:hypothetical protein